MDIKNTNSKSRDFRETELRRRRGNIIGIARRRCGNGIIVRNICSDVTKFDSAHTGLPCYATN